MKTLSTEYRRQLERTVIEARDVAEAGARVSLEVLAVQHHEPYGHMGAEQRTLRRRLRAHARQLGDRPDARSGGHSIDHLVHECAYERWHGMLFARFLAENQLLIEPQMGVAITLDECGELAKDEGVDQWMLAARFAHRMLPQVFRPDHPMFEVQFAREHRLKLEGLVEGVPVEVFAATDSLGWVYQFWQTKKKGEVNAAGNKIGANELPSVTQLFTEDYMVDFLLDNTLGAWHAGKVFAGNPRLAKNARSEGELRQAVALPGCPWRYLRFIQSEQGQWTPAAGTFDGWPKTANELKCLDPCMGSGHFVVAMFERLVALRLAEEALGEAAAVTAVIRGNLFGLEIDPRCTQIGAFNLALAAWRRVGHCHLPAMSLACSGLAPNAREAEWLAIAGNNDKLQRGMERLYRLFQKAAVLGSLINPRGGEADLLEAGFHELQPLLEKALARETNKDDTAHEMAVTACGLAKAAEILAGQFTLVATNVPFLKRGYLEQEVSDWIESHYENGKANIATAMLIRANEMAMPGGSVALVIQQSWLYQSTQRRLREQMLASCYWNSLARLGPGAFDTISGEIVNVALVTLTRLRKYNPAVSGVDTYADKGSDAKATQLREGILVALDQVAQSANPQSTVMFPGGVDGSKLIGEFCDLGKGSVTGDSSHFIRQFWEQRLTTDWEPWLNTPEGSLFSGRHQVVFWQNDGNLVRLERGARIHGQNVWRTCGFLVGKTSFAVGIYLGEMFDDNTGVLAPASKSDLAALLCFSSSDEFEEAIRNVDQELKVTIGNFGKITLDLDSWRSDAAEKYPHGLPKPFSSDPTQWLFNGYPAGADLPLHVTVARLLGYQWPRQSGSSFPDCPALGPDGLERLADDDGIVCISAVRGERPAHERVLQMLQAAWGDEWNDGILAELLADAASLTLDDWLRNEFFEQHCKLFHHRPFIWHIWDGRKGDGFHALVNYHKLAEPDCKGRRLLESLTYSYLGNWINRQQDGVKRGEGGAEDRLAAALELQMRLAAILEGEPPFDLFVRWKPLGDQPIGWEPDINDGVRLNIRPFMAQDIPGGKKGAGILRAKPNVHWKKDRGKEPVREQSQYPWFGRRGKFTGERINDLHFTVAEKRAACDRAREKK